MCKLYFDFVKVIFRLSAEVKVNPQLAQRANITVEDNITAVRHIAFADRQKHHLPQATPRRRHIVAAGNINKKPLAVARGFQTENYC